VTHLLLCLGSAKSRGKWTFLKNQRAIRGCHSYSGHFILRTSPTLGLLLYPKFDSGWSWDVWSSFEVAACMDGRPFSSFFSDLATRNLVPRGSIHYWPVGLFEVWTSLFCLILEKNLSRKPNLKHKIWNWSDFGGFLNRQKWEQRVKVARFHISIFNV